MLFSAVGQGYIFLLLLCVGAGLGLVEILSKIATKMIKKISQKNHKKIPEKSKIIPPNSVPKERKIEFVMSQKEPQKNNSKNKKKIAKNISQKSKKILKNVCFCVLGVGKVLIFGAVLYGVVLVCDYGELRAYHFLAFLLGFWLTKTIFAKLTHHAPKYAKL